ncbi:MAG: CAP domain-containing protein [Chloroflexota bacterium]
MKMRSRTIALLFVFMLLFEPAITVSARPGVRPIFAPNPHDLIAAINALRQTNGLPGYRTNAILMQIAQAHAEYMADAGVVTHVSSNGARPFQRALTSGYLVAGDLTLGGLFLENITAGVNKSIDQVVQEWLGDAPHANTMLSPTLQDIGAGIAARGTTYYFVVDVGLSTGGTPVAYTPFGPSPTATILPNTPNPDGAISHVVQPGQTLLTIAIAYGVDVNTLLRLNNLTLDSFIYPDQQLLIQAAFTPTAILPTPTPTRFPTATSFPTSTRTPTPTLSATEISSPPSTIPLTPALGAVAAIVITALLVAGISVVAASKRK